METQKKCSKKIHSDLNAIIYCLDCNIYLCNKCVNHHSEIFDNHKNYNLDKNIQEIFTNICKEPNHKDELEFYCKNHNVLCCPACLSKIKGKGNGQHHNCDVCLIEEIKQEKQSKLKDNIKYLEEFSDKIEKMLEELKIIMQNVNANKEELKMIITKTFTKIRNKINEREDEIMSEVDNLFNAEFAKEDIIKQNEKLPYQLKTNLEKFKLVDKEWDNNKINLNSKINDCLNIEYNIQNIIEINKNIEKSRDNKKKIKFSPENDDEIKDFYETIKKFGKILIEEEPSKFDFNFNPGQNYTIMNNGAVAKKTSGGDEYNCTIIGNKELPKNGISKFKIKINKIYNKNWSILIGIGPNNPNNEFNFYNKCWSFNCQNSCLSIKSGNNTKYNQHSGCLKNGDIIEVIVDRKIGNLSFKVNDLDYGIAISNLPKDDILYPVIINHYEGQEVEIV